MRREGILMLWIENVHLAISAIKANKLRSFLTMLGIIIGISSVISITSIGASAKGAVSDEFDSLGKAYMYLMINYSQLAEMYTDYSIMGDDLFSQEDVDALKERFPQDIRYATLYTYNNSETRVGRTTADLAIMGVAEGYSDYNKTIQLVYGRMINESDVKGSRDRVVVDVECARKLFGREDVVGEELPIQVEGDSRDFIIVGVYQMEETLSSQINAAMGMSSYSVYVPFSSMLSGEGVSSYIEIYGNPDKDVRQQGEAYANYMNRIKDKPEDFYMVETAEGQQDIINQVLGVLSVAIGAIAAISLLVGGIGIMNIMLVSVTERTREIGIRKSLGARTRDILTQFLIEAVILSVIGGIIGTMLGVGIAALGMSIAGVRVVVQPLVVVLAVLFSAGVGLFFGLFPARRAAKLDPIEALRYE